MEHEEQSSVIKFKLSTTSFMDNEFDFMILHIENQAETEILSYWIDYEDRILNIIFKNNNFKI